MKSNSYHTSMRFNGKDGYYHCLIWQGHFVCDQWLSKSAETAKYLKSINSKELTEETYDLIMADEYDSPLKEKLYLLRQSKTQGTTIESSDIKALQEQTQGLVGTGEINAQEN